ncbi:MAG: Gfo/Idh/MocA family oxidoreductase [Candidatus Hydrogenedentes bacterium]|nr:Gfo/Idh/MocA family oxidoreductase [Candidatus Hydrogenedentota bacterium]
MAEKKQKQGRFTRREFLKRTTIAAMSVGVFPHIIPSSALGLDGSVPPSERIIVGCIGMGGMGMANLDGFLDQASAQVVAVCDVDENHLNEAIKKVNEKYGNQDCKGYKDFRELLAREDIDAVSIALPDHWHAIPAIMAARAGKDIYGEKPLAGSIREGRAIVDAVEQYGRIWQTGSWQRSQEHFRQACELVRNGYIGEVKLVKVGLPAKNSIRKGDTRPSEPPSWFDYEMWLGPAPWAPYCEARCHWNFRWISDYAGGQLTDWAGHHCDIAQWGMGTELSAPVEIIPRGGNWPKAEEGLFDTVEDYEFLCVFREGFEMLVSARIPGGARFEGTEGWIHVDRGKFEAHPRYLVNTEVKPHELHLYRSTNHIGNFLECVKTRKKTITPAEVAHHSIMIGHLGLIALKLGRPLKFNPESETFVNDPEADRMLCRPMRAPWHLNI